MFIPNHNNQHGYHFQTCPLPIIGIISMQNPSCQPNYPILYKLNINKLPITLFFLYSNLPHQPSWYKVASVLDLQVFLEHAVASHYSMAPVRRIECEWKAPLLSQPSIAYLEQICLLRTMPS